MVTEFFNRISQINVQRRFMVDDSTWPPGQPKVFIPLLLVHGKSYRTPQQVKTMAELMCSGDVGRVVSVTIGDQCQKVFNASKATKQIKEILVPLENSEESCFILIEGAPGIGKSVFLKEIAYKWGAKQLLQKFELVLLLCLRDPRLQQIEDIDGLLESYCKGDKNATEIANACKQYLFANGGKTLLLLLDGYDEYPEYLRKEGLVSSIL